MEHLIQRLVVSTKHVQGWLPCLLSSSEETQSTGKGEYSGRLDTDHRWDPPMASKDEAAHRLLQQLRSITVEHVEDGRSVLGDSPDAFKAGGSAIRRASYLARAHHIHHLAAGPCVGGRSVSQILFLEGR